jgi:2-polyprenyl-6-methoxyphenol hydroxylase-like FAD-dependent oxidoreductase
MNITIIGGGPAGLYFSYLIKRDNPDYNVSLIEQNPQNATFGFGVVFSDRALEFLRADDEYAYKYLSPHMRSWSDLKIVHKDKHMAIDGNGFAAIGRLEFLNLLQKLCLSVDVKLEFNTTIKSLKEFNDSDLIVACDGVNSNVRNSLSSEFKTKETILQNPFIWFGTSKVFDCLSLTFRENTEGVFCAHHYPYSSNMSTFIVETNASTYQNAGFAQMNTEESRVYCEKVFSKDLDNHILLSNKSEWRWFPQIWNDNWSSNNIVLIGDSLHTAHFSIGSGTRLAMEDAISLYKSIKANPNDIDRAIVQYERNRRPQLEKLVSASVASALWYEKMDILMRTLSPYEFARSYMTRTGRISDEKLKVIAPRFMEEYTLNQT